MGIFDFLFGGTSSRQKNIQGNAFDSAGRITRAYNEDPRVARAGELATGIANNPYTFDPTTVAQIKGNANDAASQAFHGSLQNLYDTMGGSGMLRSGPARQGEENIALRLGQTIADSNRNVDTQVATQRKLDENNAINTIFNYMQQRWSPEWQSANLHAGIGAQPLQRNSGFLQNIAGIFGSGGPLAGIFGGGGGGGGGYGGAGSNVYGSGAPGDVYGSW